MTEYHPYMTVKESAAFLNVSRWTIQRLISSGRLDSVKIAGARRIPHASVVEYLETSTAYEASIFKSRRRLNRSHS